MSTSGALLATTPPVHMFRLSSLQCDPPAHCFASGGAGALSAAEADGPREPHRHHLNADQQYRLDARKGRGRPAGRGALHHKQHRRRLDGMEGGWQRGLTALLIPVQLFTTTTASLFTTNC